MKRINRHAILILIMIKMVLYSSSLFAQENPPNIILIITDQHSGKILSQQGYPYLKTPGIDKIADQGVTFTRSYCTNPVCTSSRKSFMTGKMPYQLDDLTTHASIGGTLLNAGYETAYYGKWHVGSTHMDELEDWHGFETYIDARDDSDIAGWSIDFIRKEHTKPFFMVTSFLNPHDCCELARNMSGIEDNYHDGPVVENMDTAYCPPLPSNFAIPENEAEGFYGRRNQDPGDNYYRSHPTKLWTEVEWRQYMYGYDRLVEKVDAHIESIYDELEQKGMLENTVIIYTSDHGDGHASHQWNQKKTFYEESVNIPFIVSWRDRTRKGIIDQETLTSNGLDIFPTILGFAGISIPKSLNGVDLQTVVLNDTKSVSEVQRDYVVSEINQKLYTGHTPGRFYGRMLVTNNLKYILFDKGVNREQLFDLEVDPGELHPVTDDPAYSASLIACRGMLKEWTKITGDNFKIEEIISEYESDAHLNDILVNSQSLTGFAPGTFEYNIETAHMDSLELNAIPVNSGSTVAIKSPEDIEGEEAKKRVEILVASEDGSQLLTYQITVDVTSGSDPGVGTDPTSISEPADHLTEQMVIYPNPAKHTVRIRIPEKGVWGMAIHSLDGRMVYYNPLQNWDSIFHVDHLKSGMYTVSAKNRKRNYSTSFIIQ